MPAFDPVPCYYTGQNYRWEKPAELRLRSEVRKLKKLKLGNFADNGRIFIFFQQVASFLAEHWNGKMGAGSVLQFIRTKCYGDHLHYEIPMAGDRTALARSGLRRCDDGKKLATRERNVSTRGIFSQPGMQWRNYAFALNGSRKAHTDGGQGPGQVSLEATAS